MPISKPHSSMASENTGSCDKLVDYLDKENQELDKLASNTKSHDEAMSFYSRQQSFFSHQQNVESRLDVQDTIDKNKRKLGKKDAKFYAPTLSFSKNELEHVAKLATNGRTVTNVKDMNITEFNKYNALLRDYARKAMDEYARNFNRQDKGLKSGKDLVYFGKIEHQRRYKGIDKAVLKGLAKTGEIKPGLQSHVHIIVSRKDKTQRLKLDPTTNAKKSKRVIGKNRYTIGFERKSWANKNEKIFDKMFVYHRKELEKFETLNILKNGTLQQKYELKKKLEKQHSKQKINHKTLER